MLRCIIRGGEASAEVMRLASVEVMGPPLDELSARIWSDYEPRLCRGHELASAEIISLAYVKGMSLMSQLLDNLLL